MSKRRISLTILLAAVVMTCFVGCGKKEPGTTIAEGEIDISELIAENKTEEDKESLEESSEETLEEQIISFECMDEIREADPGSGLIQIDDVIIQYGCKISEMMEKIENSQSSFGCYDDYVYNENELVLSNDSVNMLFAKDGDFYFQVQARNLTDETVSLKDCVVGRIITQKSAKGNVFYAGFDEQMGDAATYENVKNVAMKDYKLESETSESDANNLQKKYIKILYIIPNSTSQSGELWLYFVFDSDTGELSRIMMNSTAVQ